MNWTSAAWILGSYLLGSVSFAYLVGKWVSGIDIRTVGSGNLGATNVGRACGRKWGFLVYFLDFLKGLVPVLIAVHLLGDPLLFGEGVPLALLMGGAAVLGHCFPVWLRFKGGKGVATTSGAVLALIPAATLAALGAFLVGVLATKRMAVGSCLAALTLPLAHLLITWPETFDRPRHLAVFWFCSILGILVVVLHRTNIARILDGTEPRIGDGI